MTRDVHVIVPCIDPLRCVPPEHAAAGAPVLDAFSRLLRDERDLAHALRLHASEHDVPQRTPESLDDLRRVLSSDRHLIQFRLTVPDRAAELAAGPDVLVTPAPPDTLLLGTDSLARLACVSRRKVRYAMQHGLVRVLRSTSHRGRVCRYAIVDPIDVDPIDRRSLSGAGGRLDAWADRFARLVPVADVTIPKEFATGRPWFRRAEATEVFGEEVFTDGRWLRWAAARQPEGERQAILAGQVMEPHDSAAEHGTP